MSLNGDVLFNPRSYTAERVKVQEFVRALGLLPTDGWEAVDGEPVPVGLLMYVTTYGARDIHSAIGLDMRRTLYGGTTSVFHRTPLIGETFTVAPAVGSITERDGRGGALTFVEVRCEYADEAGAPVFSERSVAIQTGVRDV